MPTVEVQHLGGDRFEIGVRRHRLVVDQSVADGGDDRGPTPTELFVASLAACIAHYARRYLSRHGLPVAGLRVSADYDIEPRPARVGAVSIAIEAPGLPDHRRAALLAVASHCTVHNTLDDVPPIRIALTRTAETAA